MVVLMSGRVYLSCSRGLLGAKLKDTSEAIKIKGLNDKTSVPCPWRHEKNSFINAMW